MRVVVPYFPEPHPRVVPAIQREGWSPVTIRCVNSVGHPDSYPKILARELLGPFDVCLIEHDVETRPGFLWELLTCTQPWCFFAYDLSVPWDDAVREATKTSGPLGEQWAPLGHTRFKAGVGESIRDTLESDLFAATWVARDAVLTPALIEAGYVAHRHAGKAIHHHDYSESG